MTMLIALIRLEAQLQPFEDLQKSHAILQAKVTELSARSQVAEADVRHLNEENANLLGHTNANQKISHLQNLRTELSDIRKVNFHSAYFNRIED